MWKLITNCSRQLTIHSKIREKDNDLFTIFEIVEVEFDQYKLKLIEKKNLPVADGVEQILNCRQLIEYGLEVEQKG